MSIELKIKSKHLASESKIIDAEIKKLKRKMKELKSLGRSVSEISIKLDKLIIHKRNVVSKVARNTHLARAFIAGVDYHQVEEHVKSTTFHFKYGTIPLVNLTEIARMVKNYSDFEVTEKDIVAWINEQSLT